MDVETTLFVHSVLLIIITWRLIAGAERFNGFWRRAGIPVTASGRFIAHHWPLMIGLVAVGIVSVYVSADVRAKRAADISEANHLHRIAARYLGHMSESIDEDRELTSREKEDVSGRFNSCVADAAEPTLWLPVPNLTVDELNLCYVEVGIPQRLYQAMVSREANLQQQRNLDLMGSSNLTDTYRRRTPDRKRTAIAH